METAGLIVVAAVLTLGSIAGWWWRRSNGRFTSVGLADGSGRSMSASVGPAPGVSATHASPAAPAAADSGAAFVAADSGPAFVAADSGAACVAADSAAAPAAADSGPVFVAADSGAVVAGAGGSGEGPRSSVDSGAAGQRIAPGLLAELGVEPSPVTLLQFSSAFCAPCRAVRRVSGEVAVMLPGVRHVEVDAESHLAAVRALGIWRTPTLLVLDAEGRVVKRATGVPAKAQLIAVLGDLLPTV